MPDTVKPEEVKLAKQVMGTFEGDVDLQEYRDDYQVGLREIIDAKIEGREIVAQEVEAPPKVVNLMEALRKSLDTVSATKKRPAKVVAQKAQGGDVQVQCRRRLHVQLHPGDGHNTKEMAVRESQHPRACGRAEVDEGQRTRVDLGGRLAAGASVPVQLPARP